MRPKYKAGRVYGYPTVTDEEFQRLVTIFNNRYALECHAFGVKVLHLRLEEGGWVCLVGIPDAPDNRRAYIDYLDAMIDFAKHAKRINHREPAKGTSEKYAFRTWLNRIGLKGPEFKATRKVLLANLSGSGTRAFE